MPLHLNQTLDFFDAKVTLPVNVYRDLKWWYSKSSRSSNEIRKCVPA